MTTTERESGGEVPKPLGGAAATNLTSPEADAQRHDHAIVLVEHARWADAELFDAAAALSDEQLDRSFEMGLGTLRETLTHIVGAARGWIDIYRGSDTRPWLGDQGPFGIDALSALMHETYNEWVDALATLDRSTLVERERDGARWTISRAEMITHVFTHAAHHRAQCINMLRRLGVDPLPTGGLAKWVYDRCGTPTA
jgi:uncharacterized damage-inducible protein DinB